MIHHGDCLEVLRTLPDNSVDAVVTDPPYGLSFMGKRWDYDVPAVEVWAECLRVLKPGGHLLAFAGTRTQHRMAVRIEDAGFEIRDMIAWVYASGFPKSLDVSKAIDKAAGAKRDRVRRVRVDGKACGHGGGSLNSGSDVALAVGPAVTAAARQWSGWGTALKPALEPITVARKPLSGTVAENVLRWGTGALNVDGCRVATKDDCARKPSLVADTAAGFGKGAAMGGRGHDAGRWPANLIHDGSEEVVGLFPQAPGQMARARTDGADQGNNVLGALKHVTKNPEPRGDTGSAARFFKECNEWPDQSRSPSSADTAQPSLCLQSVVAATVQSVAATWPSLAGIVSSDLKERSTSATANECESIAAVCTAAMTVIGSGCSQESRHEKRTLSGSLASAVVTREPTGITTITVSLSKSDGSVGHVTFSITPTNLDRGALGSRFSYCAKASKRDRGEGNAHPTVKPTDLMRYLCRLVTPPGGVVLDPFAGSGSTGKACALEGFQFIGIEREAEYVKIARARIAAAKAGMGLFAA